MRDVDCSDGGGQLFRTALALAAVTGEAVEITGIRGSRPDPGLKQQHLAALEVLSAVTDAEVTGGELGAESITFDPGSVSAGEYAVDVGTAGSATLVCDALLPLVVALDGRLSVTVTGGTDVKWSPSADYYRHVKLPLFRSAGFSAALDLRHRGFYPRGGGELRLSTAPSSVRLRLTDRGERLGARVYSVATDDLADADVAERQTSAAVDRIQAAGLSVLERSTTYVSVPSTGTAVVVRLDYDRTLAGFDSLGEPGTPAEDVAASAVESALAFDRGGGAVDRHLADQTLPFLALCGGEVAILDRTDHVDAALDLLAAFGYDVDVDRRDSSILLSSPGSG